MEYTNAHVERIGREEERMGFHKKYLKKTYVLMYTLFLHFILKTAFL